MRNMDVLLQKHVDVLLQRYPELTACRDSFVKAYEMMQDSFAQGGKLLIAGNGGSAADSQHMAGELMKRFKLPRPVSAQMAEAMKALDPIRGQQMAESLERCLPAISLSAHEAAMTAFINDVGSADVYAQQVLGYGKQGDVFLAISTSGNSENLIRAAITARCMGIKVIGLTGKTGGKMAPLCDVAVKVPDEETYRIQEFHLPIYHAWCLMLEEYFFGK